MSATATTPATLDRTIGELVAERPGRARVFEGFRIDYCCGGKRPLGEACAAKGIDPQVVLNMLAIADDTSPKAELDLTTATLTQLCDDVEATHHAYLKRELPRIEFMARKVADRHGAHNVRLIALRDVFLTFKAELESHMMKEERVLFPICRQLESSTALPRFHCGSVRNPIQQMVHEHDDAGAALEKMRQLTDGFTAPEGACNTFRAYYDALAELERDMHRHVHKENSVLFPKAAALEQTLAGAGSAFGH